MGNHINKISNDDVNKLIKYLKDKNVTYKATLDWYNVIELSEVPKEYVIDSFATYVDDNENIEKVFDKFIIIRNGELVNT